MRNTITYAALILGLLSTVMNAQAGGAAYGGGGQTSLGESGRYTLNHMDVGVYADLFRLSPGNSTINYTGVGGRAAFSVHPNVAVEGEMDYDFARNYTNSFSTGSGSTTTTTFVTSSVRPITGLFGPKFQLGGSGPFRIFATGKVGFLDFSSSSPNSVTGSQFASGVGGIGGSGTHFAAYPGGGFEGFFGPLGFRAEAGDEIFLNNGTDNNLRVTVGPTLRF